MKEIKPKATPPHFTSKKIFGLEASYRRKLLGVFFPADPRSVLGCPDNSLAAPPIGTAK